DAEGFRDHASYENANARDTPAERRSFYRFALSADRTILAGWFAVPATDVRHCVVLESVARGGGSLLTASGLTDSGLPLPPGRLLERHAAETPVTTLVARHREQVERIQLKPRTFAGMADAL